MCREIIIGIIVGVFTLLGVYLERHLSESRTRKHILGALYDEIDLNLAVARKNLPIVLPTYYRPLYSLSYQHARTSGELMTLPRDTRTRLEETYDSIYFFNRRVEIGHGFADKPNFLESMKNDLEYLHKEFTIFLGVKKSKK